MIEELRTIHVGAGLTAPMFLAFEALNLIEPIALNLHLSETEQINMEGYFTVAAERLHNLSGSDLEALNRSGFLQAAFETLASLENFTRLIELRELRYAKRDIYAEPIAQK